MTIVVFVDYVLITMTENKAKAELIEKNRNDTSFCQMQKSALDTSERHSFRYTWYTVGALSSRYKLRATF